MSKRKKTSKKTSNEITIEYPIYKYKHGLKLFYIDDKVLALKIHPLDYYESAKYADMLESGEFSVKKVFKELLPRLEEFVEIDSTSDIKIKVEDIKQTDPTRNPLTFQELLELVLEIIKVSGILQREEFLEDTLLKQEVIGIVRAKLKPLGVFECAEAYDILSNPTIKDKNQKFIELFFDSYLDYIDFETDADIDIDKLLSDNVDENPLLYSQITDMIINLLKISKVIGDINKFRGEDKKVRRNRRG